MQQKEAENQARELKQTIARDIDLEGRLMRSNTEKTFLNDKLKVAEKTLARKEADVVDLERQLNELRDSKFDKSQ